GVLVSLLRLTWDEAADEVRGYSWNLPEALSGWRSVQELYDPRGLLRSLRDRSLRPRAHQFREAARGGFLGTFEDYGKLLNALEAEDTAEAFSLSGPFPHRREGPTSAYSRSPRSNSAWSRPASSPISSGCSSTRLPRPSSCRFRSSFSSCCIRNSIRRSKQSLLGSGRRSVRS